MNTHECSACNGHGEYSSGRSCPRCRGTGQAMCVLCTCRPGTVRVEEDDPEWLTCAECDQVLRADRCGICLGPGEIPVAIVNKLPACTSCWVAAGALGDTEPPTAPDTIPCPANDFDGPESDELLLALQLTTALIDAARDAEIPPHVAARSVRKAAGRVGR